MTRPLRIEFDGAWYHVMNRGKDKQEIFHNNSQRKYFIKLLEEASCQYKIEIHAYCLMPNHYHLLIHTPIAGLSRSMRHINGLYTQFFNKTENKDGPLFRGRYKAILVEDDFYLLNVSRYIHLNPVSAGMVVKNIDEYAWSSLKNYIKPFCKKSWVYTDFILSFLGEINQSNLYLDFIYEGIDQNTLKFYAKKKQSIIFGSDKFANKHLNKITKNTIRKVQPDYNRSIKSPLLDEVLNQCAVYFNINPSEILQYRRGKRNFPRELCMYLCHILSQKTLNDIAPYFGCKSINSVSIAINKIKVKLNQNKSIAFHIEQIKKGVRYD